MKSRLIKFANNTITNSEYEELLREASSKPEVWNQLVQLQNIKALEALQSSSEDIQQGKASYTRFVKTKTSQNSILPRIKSIYSQYSAYAAVLTLFISIVSTFFATKWHLQHRDIGYTTINVPIGQRASITLPDGSAVWINSNSSLSYPAAFEAGERRVKLIGEAYFEVAHQNKRPFIVNAPHFETKVLGTKFNICSYPNDSIAKADLIEGSVALYNNDATEAAIILKPGEQAIYNHNNLLQIDQSCFNANDKKSGIFRFDNSNMAEILRQLENYYNVSIVVNNPSILDYEYTGSFIQGDGVMHILKLLQKIKPFSIHLSEQDNVITIDN